MTALHAVGFWPAAPMSTQAMVLFRSQPTIRQGCWVRPWQVRSVFEQQSAQEWPHSEAQLLNAHKLDIQVILSVQDPYQVL